MIRKMLVTTMALVFCAFASVSANAEALIKEIQDRGTLRIGVADGPPYQFPDAMSGEYVGLNIDLAKEAAKLLGVELEIVPATWATLITGLQVKQYDVVFANLFATPERAVTVTFTDAYDTYGFHVMVKDDSAIKSLADLNSPDVTFVAQAGTVEAKYPLELFPESKMNALATDQANAPPLAVLSGQADAVFIDPGFYRILSTQNPDLFKSARLLNGPDELLKPVSLSYALRHGDMDMLNFLNVFIHDKVANGVIAAERDRWFDKMAEK
ncbi:MAG: transporter substrate-binding domain-containing protein [Rhizobiaceae bacterium]